MQVEMVAGRCLKVSFLERLAVPGAVAFVHVHVVHVDRNPHISSGIGDFVVDMRINEEVIGAGVAILDVVDAGLFHLGEVEFHVIVFVIGSP